MIHPLDGIGAFSPTKLATSDRAPAPDHSRRFAFRGPTLASIRSTYREGARQEALWNHHRHMTDALATLFLFEMAARTL